MQLERAEILIQQGRFDLAEKELRAHLESDPSDGLALAMLSICFSERGQIDRSIEVARSAVQTAPTDPAAHLALSMCIYRAGGATESVHAAQQAIRLDPNNPDAWAQFAWARLLQGYAGDALNAAKRGLALDPQHVECLNANASALAALGSTALAAKLMSGSLARCPEAAASHSNAGWIALQRNDVCTAEHHFREALRIDPRLKQPLEGLYLALKWRNPLLRYLYEQGFDSPWRHRQIRIALGFVLLVALWLIVLAFIVSPRGRPWCAGAGALLFGLVMLPIAVREITARVILHQLKQPQSNRSVVEEVR